MGISFFSQLPLLKHCTQQLITSTTQIIIVRQSKLKPISYFLPRLYKISTRQYLTNFTAAFVQGLMVTLTVTDNQQYKFKVGAFWDMDMMTDICKKCAGI